MSSSYQTPGPSGNDGTRISHRFQDPVMESSHIVGRLYNVFPSFMRQADWHTVAQVGDSQNTFYKAIIP